MYKILFLIPFLYFSSDVYSIRTLNKIKLPMSGIEKVVCDKEGNFYILNSEKNILLKIDTTGNVLDSIIKGKGEDVRKSRLLSDIIYDKKNESILISDIMLHRISEFGKNGEFINSFWLPELFGNIGICGDTIFVRILEKYEEIDSLTYEALLMKKVDRKNGSSLGKIVKILMNKKIDDFFSMPFCIDCKNRLIYMIFPPDKIQIIELNGSIIYEIIEPKWLFITDVFLLNKYLVISSFSEDGRSYISSEMVTYWKNISISEVVRREIMKRRLFKVKEEPPMAFEEVSYVIDVFDIDKKEFILESYLPPGKLVGGKNDKIFFVSYDTLFIVELK